MNTLKVGSLLDIKYKSLNDDDDGQQMLKKPESCFFIAEAPLVDFKDDHDCLTFVSDEEETKRFEVVDTEDPKFIADLNSSRLDDFQ